MANRTAGRHQQELAETHHKQPNHPTRQGRQSPRIKQAGALPDPTNRDPPAGLPTSYSWANPTTASISRQPPEKENCHRPTMRTSKRGDPRPRRRFRRLERKEVSLIILLPPRRPRHRWLRWLIRWLWWGVIPITLLGHCPPGRLTVRGTSRRAGPTDQRKGTQRRVVTRVRPDPTTPPFSSQSHASPRRPIDTEMPAPSQRVPNAAEVYCLGNPYPSDGSPSPVAAG